MALPPIVSKLSRYINLEDPEIAVLEALSRERRTVTAGTKLLGPDEPYSSAFIIHDGWALRSRQLPGGRRQILNFLLPGDAFGLGGMLLSRPDHGIVAITSITRSPVAPEALMAMLRTHPRLGAALVWGAAQEEAVLREHIVSIGRRTAYERVAHLLLELMNRLEMIGQAEGDTFALPLSQPLLADALGLSVVHVNRTLRRLQREGLISTQPRRISVLDRRALEDVAEFQRSALQIPSAARDSPLAKPS